MIFADTNIIIDLWKKPTDEYIRVFETEEIAICGVVVAELLHGAKSSGEANKLLDALEDLTFINVTHNDWIGIGKMLNTLRSSGITVPFQDAVIGYLARTYNLELWSNDQHFHAIRNVFSDLSLFTIK